MRAAVLFTVLSGLLLVCCAPPQTPTTTSQPGVVSGPGVDANEVKACTARGGSMHRVCLMGNMACVISYPDAGKTCTDKDECTGQCRFAGGTPPPPSATARGVCQQTSDPCGCFSQIIRGKVQPALCVD